MKNKFPYLRNSSYRDREYYRKEVPGECNFFEQSYNCEMRIGKYIFSYKLDQFVYCFINNFVMEIQLNDSISKSLDKILSFSNYFTRDSIRKAFASYPYTQSLILNWKYSAIEYSGGSLKKQDGFRSKSYFYENFERKWAEEMFSMANGLMKELENMIIDFSLLKKPEPVNLPHWITKAAAIGIPIIIKFAAKSICNNVDFDFDFDYNVNMDDSNYELPELDLISETVSDPSFDSNESYNVNFLGRTKDSLPVNANSDGYIPDGTIELDRQNGRGSETFKLYNKNGNDYVLYYGKYIKISGKDCVNIGGIKYDC